jgi:multisubunit Na+/H+ antiporter MnhB subunit
MAFIQIENQREALNMKQYLKISTLIVTALAVLLLFTSFNEVFNPSPWGENEDYLFPRFIAGGIAVLALLLWFERDDKGKPTNFIDLLPGLGLILAYLISMNTIGFYMASMIMFFAVIMIYKKPEETKDFWRVLLIKLSISVVFILILYGLFTLMLQVRLPRGLLF